MKNSIIFYFILALGITWLFWIPTILISIINGYFLPGILTFNKLITEGFVDDLHIVVFTLNQVGVYGPIIAAFTLLLLSKKKTDVIAWLKSMVKVKIHIKWYGIIFALPFIIFLLGALLSNPASLTNLFNSGISLPLILLMFLNTLLTSGLEEPGWRGYALPKLQESNNANKSSVILGFIWAIWHFPFLIYLYIFQLNMDIFLAILSLAGYIASTIGISIIYTWIYNNTKSVFIMILFHTLLNVIPQLMLGGVTDSAGGVFVALVTWAIAIILTRKFGEETLIKLTEKELRMRQEKKQKKQQ